MCVCVFVCCVCVVCVCVCVVCVWVCVCVCVVCVCVCVCARVRVRGLAHLVFLQERKTFLTNVEEYREGKPILHRLGGSATDFERRSIALATVRSFNIKFKH